MACPMPDGRQSASSDAAHTTGTGSCFCASLLNLLPDPNRALTPTLILSLPVPQSVGGWGSDDAFGPGDAVPRAPPGGGRFTALDDRPVSADRLEFLRLNAARLRTCAATPASIGDSQHMLRFGTADNLRTEC